MARSAAVAVENSFIKGLITEATGLNFPENACTETYDCVFDEKGKVLRRLGINYEDGFMFTSLSTSNTGKVISYFVWENVAGRGDLTFVVIQFGATLYVYSTSSSQGLSSNQLFTIALSSYVVSGAPAPEGKECSFASGNGALFVTHPYCNPFYCTYDPDTQSHTEAALTLQIRDFTGVEDNLAVDSRPSTLTALHKYNLQNQGWTAFTNYWHKSALDAWDQRRTDFPSNADIWWTMKNSNDDFDPDNQSDKTFKGNTHAPQGHYLLNPFYEDRTSASGVGGLTVATSGYFRPSTCAFHAGRIFYSGVGTGTYSNKIYFTQIVHDSKQYANCYQAQDPTSQDDSDLLPNDGGVIAILGAGQILLLASVQSFLVVIATNGIWAISGSQGIGFTANDYSVSKLSDIATQSTQSLVFSNGFPFWWTNDGIVGLAYNTVAANLELKSLTDKTIKTFFEGIPVASKASAKGAYNSKTKVIQWTYRSTDSTLTEEHYQHDRVLAFNVLTGSFYPWRITQPSSTLGPWIGGVFSTKGVGAIRQSENVTDNAGGTVVDNAAANVTVSATTTQYLTSSFRYITIYKNGANYSLSFAQEKDANYVDWGSSNYQSYAITGYKVHGQGSVKFQSNYLTVFMDTVSEASCFLQAWWDYAQSATSGKMSDVQQAYHHDNHFALSQVRLKMRGEGRALQFKFYSESGKPFTLVGWSGFETGNTSP